MLPVFQRHVSQVKKFVPIITKENIFYLVQLSIFLELRCVLLRCEKRKEYTLDGITNPKYKLLCSLTTNFFAKRRRHYLLIEILQTYFDWYDDSE